MSILVTGGNIQTFESGSPSITYKSHTFTSGSGTFTVVSGSTGTGSITAQVLIVGGGGGGSLGGGGESNVTNRGNGGGGGGVTYIPSRVFLTSSVWSVTIGDGGLGGYYNIPATNGGISNFTSASISFTGSYGGYGGQPEGGAGASGGGSYPTGAMSIFGLVRASASINASTSSFSTSSFYSGSSFQLTGSTQGYTFTPTVGTFILTGSIEIDSNSTYYITYPATASVVANQSLIATAIANKINSLSSSFNILANNAGTTLTLTSSFAGIIGNNYWYASGSFSQSFQGGANNEGYNGGTQQGKSGAGGGGAAGTGSDATTYYNNPFTIYNGGNGGPGKALTLRTGSVEYYGAGGGGGGWVNTSGGGGIGIGGNGGGLIQTAGGDGVPNTGAGGGGGALSDQSSNWGTGGNGGSGVVIITYPV
jgi:hypothetical protein